MTKSFFEIEWSKMMQLENFLIKNQYFSKDYLPGIADSLMFEIFDNQFPIRERYPSLYYWYITIKQFSPQAIRKWSIKSDSDEYFRELLKQYKHWKDSHNNIIPYSLKNLQSQNLCPSAKQLGQEYAISISFNTNKKSTINQIMKNVENKNKIINKQIVGERALIQLKCNTMQIQNLKADLDNCHNITNYELRKVRRNNKKRSSAFMGC